MLNLPPPDHTPLDHASLPLVVAQARFSTRRADLTLNEVTAFQHQLRDAGLDLPRVTPIESRNILVGMNVASESVTARGFQLATSDGQWLVTITTDAVALETPGFRSYAGQFQPLFTALVGAATAAVEPVTLTRAGLRFVNLLRRPDKLPDGDVDWARWVRGSLVAVTSDEVLSAGMVAHAQQMVLVGAEGVRATVRSGSATAGVSVDAEANARAAAASGMQVAPTATDADAFVIDIDVYSEPSSLWDCEDVLARFEALNGSGVALFYALVTDEMVSNLKDSGRQDPSEGAVGEGRVDDE